MKFSRYGMVFMALLMAAMSMVTFWPSPAQAGITITPTIVLIEGRQRYADINLINSGDEPVTYDMQWRFFKQTEDTGIYQNANASVTDFDLTKHIVFTPRRVTLMPGVVQKIRLGMRLQGEPPAPGDYRGHFEIMEVPIARDPEAPKEEKRVSVGIHVNVGFSIPVIYRVGDGNATATIGDVTTAVNPKTGKIEASVPIIRGNGPYGALGHIRIYYGDKQIGELKNANIFPEITHRVFVLPLEVKTLSGGSLRIVYKDQDEKKNITFAEKSVPIGK